MLSLALRSLRYRPGRLCATLLAAFLGAAVLMSFNSLLDTAQARGVDDTSAKTLGLIAGVVGGYGALLVFFALASTMTVNVRQRGEEIALLRSAGATPAQITRMVVLESLVVGVVGFLLAVGPAALGGGMLLGMLRDSGRVRQDVHHAFGPIALGSGIGVTLMACACAAFLAVRRAMRDAAGVRRASRTRVRVVVGGVAIAAGAAGTCTTFAFDASDASAMAPAAYGSVLIAAGLALFAPQVLQALAVSGQGLLERLAGSSGCLSALNLRARAARQSAVLVPLILFIDMATATLTMQAIGNDALESSPLAAADGNVETVNLAVVGIIVAFCCVMLVNSLYASTADRGREFGQQRLAGATPGQVLGTVAVEAAVLTVVGGFFGTVAGIAGILPFNALMTDSVVPDHLLGIWLGTTGVAAGATLITTWATARRVLRRPAVSAVEVTV